MVALPRFELDDEYGDDTRPVGFVLKLPPTFTIPTPPAPFAPPPVPWAMDSTPEPRPARTKLLVVLASAILGSAVAVAGLAAPAGDPDRTEPVGIAVRAPKTLDKSVRSRDRIGGVSLPTNAVTVSIDSMARPRRRRF
jgi:hypothetical protein